jgi:hypothetical protein
MAGQRKRYSVELKTKVALEAIKGHKTAHARLRLALCRW